jgi:iron complex outermembrane receptor protein
MGIIYTYTRAIIDSEADLGSSVNGNNLPGVPRNSVIANLNYQFMQNANINLSHTWRESTSALNDINNNFSQKQGRYESTNLAASYRYQNYQLFASINNVFEHDNSLQVADDVIYPVDFARTWRIGVKVDL